jgi:hypothetical protein
MSTDKTIREFNDKKHYNEWQFVYDPSMDRGGLLTAPGQPKGFGQQGGVPGAPPGQNAGQGQGQPTPPPAPPGNDSGSDNDN